MENLARKEAVEKSKTLREGIEIKIRVEKKRKQTIASQPKREFSTLREKE